MPVITVPSKTGYTFGGYYTSINGEGTQYYNADGNSARNWDMMEGTTLYAKWTANIYTVEYNANGGEGTTASSTHTYGTGSALTTNGFTRTGYVFNGWNTNADGSGSGYTNGQSVLNLTETANGTVTLHAQWTPTIAFAEVGDYVEYQSMGEVIDLMELTGLPHEKNFNPADTTMWRVLRNNGTTVELISDEPVETLFLANDSRRETDGDWPFGSSNIYEAAQTNYANVVYILK